MSSLSPITPDSPCEPVAHAFVAIGSNQHSRYGTPAATVRAAMQTIAGWTDQPLLKSSLWSSAPVDCPPGSPDFINAVVGLVPDRSETPRSLLTAMLDLECRFGRQRSTVPNAPRCLDLDLICFGDRTLIQNDLILPHPRAHRRDFVLLPLAEIAPDLCLPGQSQSVAMLLQQLQTDCAKYPE